MGTVRNIFRHEASPVAALAARGWVYDLSEATLAGTVTGPITYATTSPTLIFALSAASGLAAIPLYLSLGQTGTVAGGAITVLMEKDNANRYTSGGTAATVMNSLTMGGALPTGASAFSRTGSAIVATDAAGMRMWGVTVGQDVSPAEGIPNELVWTPPAGAPDYLITTASLGASWLINTTAATTGATWLWSAKIAVFPLTDL